MPFSRQEKWKPKRRRLARVSGVPLHCQVGSLLYSALGLASSAAHAGSLLQSVSSETNPGSASGDRQGALGLAPTTLCCSLALPSLTLPRLCYSEGM